VPSPKLVSLVLLAAPVALTAQESPIADSTSFRRGQWAAQFGGGLSLATLGVLRFTSPRSAWVFDVQLSGGHSHSTVTAPTVNGDTTRESFASDARIALRVGRRFYRDARNGGPVAPFVGIGVLGGFTHSASGDYSGGFESDGWTAGTFGELGGTYRVTDHLSLGAGAEVGITYGRSKARSVSPFSPPSRASRWNYAVSAPNLRFIATLFF
jgi:hypothetical protein